MACEGVYDLDEVGVSVVAAGVGAGGLFLWREREGVAVAGEEVEGGARGGGGGEGPNECDGGVGGERGGGEVGLEFGLVQGFSFVL